MTRVDVWICPEVDLTPSLLAMWHGWMDAEETRRWQRFVREEDRRRHLLARGLARGVLAECTGVAPKALRFDTLPFGKPILRNLGGVSSPHFNLSHTRGLVVLALSHEVDVGIDVETVERGLDPVQLAERHFSKLERDALAATDASSLHERFIETWTLKEAYAKALGLGLGMDLQGFSALVDEPARVLEHAADTTRPAACRCWLHVPSQDHRIALVAQGTGAPLDVHLIHGLPGRDFARDLHA